VRVNTNGFIFHKKSDELMKLENLPNKKDLFFNITFHYYEYEKFIGSFIESIILLMKNNIKFSINFLLPDTVSLKDFLNVKNRIIDGSYIADLEFDYSLIKSTDGTISKFYSEEMLHFFKGNVAPNDTVNNLSVTYNTGEKEILESAELFYRGLNSFS